MSQYQQWRALIHFYDTHPINAMQIRQTLERQGISLTNLTEEGLQAYDQDHYGGVEAVDILAQKAGIQAHSRVLDVCSGMGGPARYLAHRYGCGVIGLDITESRCQGALELTRLVKLDHLVAFCRGNALHMPFADRTFDVIIGQEAWLHIPEKPRLIAECARVLKAGGIIAFTDVLQRGALTATAWQRLHREMAVATLETLESYKALLAEAGFCLLECQDLSKEWSVLLAQRLVMYRNLQEEAVRKFGLAHYRKWDAIYSFYVALFTTGKLGGGRFVARLKAREHV